jgi:hypothetical protein
VVSLGDPKYVGQAYLDGFKQDFDFEVQVGQQPFRTLWLILARSSPPQTDKRPKHFCRSSSRSPDLSMASSSAW